MKVPPLKPKEGVPKSSFVCVTTGGWLDHCQGPWRLLHAGEVTDNPDPTPGSCGCGNAPEV